MNPDRVGRIPPPTRRLVVRKANSHRDLRPLTERVGLDVVFIQFARVKSSFNVMDVVCSPARGLIKIWLL